VNGVDRREPNNATLVTYALARALFDELSGPAKRNVVIRALGYLPPQPNGDLPADLAMWRDARSELLSLAGMPGKRRAPEKLNARNGEPMSSFRGRPQRKNVHIVHPENSGAPQ